MAEALYRKYRPTLFAEVSEQGHVVQTVTNELKNNKVAHAYLFAGPRGVGKTTIARLLAKSLNCMERKVGQAEPCNACAACQEAKAGRFLDVIEIDAASQTKVEETRENIIENVRFAPTRGKFKVFIIDEVHMLSASSFNALLKTLEEPPSYVVFVLATTEIHKIPATIISRCERFDFHRIPAREMIERLTKIATAEGVTVEEPVLVAIARLSEGCLRDAESLLGQVFSLGEKVITQKIASLVLPATHIDVVRTLVESAAQNQAEGAIKTLKDFVEGGGSVRHLTDEILEYVRTVLFLTLGLEASDQYDDTTLKAMQAAAQNLTPARAERLLDLVLVSRGRTAPAAFPQIPLEIAFVDFCTSSAAEPQQKAETVKPSALPVAPPKVESPKPPAPAPQAPAASAADFSDLPLLAGESVQPKVVAPVAPAPAAPVGNATFTKDELTNKWGRCVALIGEQNMTLPLIMNGAQVLSVDNGVAVIGFEYAMHADKMKETKSLRLLEDAVAQIMMGRVQIQVVHTKAAKLEEADTVSTLLDAFGGAVV